MNLSNKFRETTLGYSIKCAVIYGEGQSQIHKLKIGYTETDLQAFLEELDYVPSKIIKGIIWMNVEEGYRSCWVEIGEKWEYIKTPLIPNLLTTSFP